MSTSIILLSVFLYCVASHRGKLSNKLGAQRFTPLSFLQQVVQIPLVVSTLAKVKHTATGLDRVAKVKAALKWDTCKGIILDE